VVEFSIHETQSQEGPKGIRIKKQKVSSTGFRGVPEVCKRDHQEGMGQFSISMVKTDHLAPSTPPKKQRMPTTKPFSNTTNPSPNSTFHHKQQTKSK